MKMISLLLAACTLYLAGCNPPGMANRAAAEDYTAAVAAEAAVVSLGEGSAPSMSLSATSGKLRLAALKSLGPATCACGEGCTCAAELAALRRYRDQAEAFFRARGYRASGSGHQPAQPAGAFGYGSCATGSCSVSGYSRPVRRGWFGRR